MKQEAFYATAAQVIPILFLVSLVGEARFRGFVVGRTPEESSPTQKVVELLFNLSPLLVMLIGEIAALAALASESVGSLYFSCTVMGLGFGFGFVFLSIVEQALLGSDEAVNPIVRRWVLMAFYALSVGTAMIFVLSRST